MNTDELLQLALKQLGIDSQVREIRALSTDQSQRVVRFCLSDGRYRIAKIVPRDAEDRLTAEHDGLESLARSGCIRVAAIVSLVYVGHAVVFVMEYLEPAVATAGDWARFAQDLAKHHMSDHGSLYGWERDNFIGRSPQPNGWHDDWVRFNAEHRLGFQARLARQNGVDRSIISSVEQIIDRLEDFIPRNPHPALLHGDLWSGNVIPTTQANEVRVGVIDPAVYVGDGWADIAMLKLFGGAPSVFYETYEQLIEDRQHITTRVLVYQLYHMLNHLNLFGGGYAGSVVGISDQLLARS